MSQLAYNPDTGEYLILQDGKWAPAQVAADAAGRKMYLDANGWQPIDAAGEVAAPAGTRPKDQGGMSWKEVALRGIKNVPSSGWNLLANTVNALRNPKTAVDLAQAGAGLVQKGLRHIKEPIFGRTPMPEPGVPISDAVRQQLQDNWNQRQGWKSDNERKADAMIQYFRDAYGSEAALKNKLANDPMGAAGDISALFTGGAGAAKGLGLLGKAAAAGSKAAGLGKTAAALDAASRGLGAAGTGLSMAAGATDPVALGAYPAAWAAKAMDMPQKMYRRALGVNVGFGGKKPLYDPAAIDAAVARGMETRTPVNAAGMSKAGERIAQNSEKLKSAIADADAAGITLDPLEIADRAMQNPEVSPHLSEVGRAQAQRAIQRTMDGFLDGYPDPMPLSQAQDVKQATYQVLDPAYNNNAKNVPGPVTSAKKALASELRKGIAEKLDDAAAQGVIPDTLGGQPVHEVNRTIGTDIDLRDMIERATSKAGNKGLWSSTGALAGMQASGSPWGALAGLALQAARQPGIMSKGAFLLDDMGKMGNPLRPALAATYGKDLNDRVQRWYPEAYPVPKSLLERFK